LLLKQEQKYLFFQSYLTKRSIHTTRPSIQLVIETRLNISGVKQHKECGLAPEQLANNSLPESHCDSAVKLCIGNTEPRNNVAADGETPIIPVPLFTRFEGLTRN
jgi:hypothetical protein